MDSERNQGRALDMGWLDHARLGFNYRLSDIACALGLAQLERLDGLLADPRARGGLVPRGAVGHRGPRPALRGPGAERRGWFVYVVLLPADADQRETIEALAARGIQTRPYLPPIHLMSYYRETFGHREGAFPSARRSAPARWRCRSSRG